MGCGGGWGSWGGMKCCACTVSSSIKVCHLRMICTSLLCASLLRREAGMSGTGSANVGMSEGLRADVGTSGSLPEEPKSRGKCKGTFTIKRAIGVRPKCVEPRSVCLLGAVVA